MRHLLLTSSILVAAALAGCESDRAEPLPEAAPEADPAAAADSAPAAIESPATTAAPAADLVYTVDPANSEVFWLISKAGVMARFGHNHVISAEQFSGTVTVDPNDLASSRFELEIPVADLVVDDPELRARFGEEFASVPSEEDKAGTRRNMLSETLLQGDMYPVVRVRGAGPDSTGPGSTLPIEIDIVGNTFEFDVPGEVALGDGMLEVTGEFALEHADLGLTPFSALGGALQVGPTIEFSYRIRAVQAQ